MAPTFNASSAYPGLADYPHQEHIKDGKLSHSEAHFEDDLAQDGSVDMRGNSVRRSKTGGWKACGFIIVDEISERLAYYGIASNLITYLTTVLHEGTASSARNVNNWVGVTYIVPLAGAFLADTFTGRYWSIAVFSIVYILGLVSLTLSVCIKSLRPPSCANVAACPRANSAQLGVFFFSLYLISIGTGGLKPCLEAFGADQFDEEDPKERRRKSSFFNVWNVGLCMGALTAITALVYIQENKSWGLGFGIPTAAMGVAFLCFLGGTYLYRHKRHGGSPLTRVVQVLVASLRKWRVRVPSDPALLHHRHANSSDEESLRFGRRHLQHTASLSFLDKAAVTEPEHEGMAKANPWRLCTVTQVEEVKLLFRIVPIWMATFAYGLVFAQVTTFFTKQGATMDRQMGKHFTIPAASVQSFTTVVVIVLLPIYDRVFVPFARRLTGNERGISLLQRIGVGLFLSIVSIVVAAIIEGKRLRAASHAGLLQNPKAIIPLSISWLLPQYALMGISDVFVTVGLQEFFYDQMPDGLRSLGMAFYLCASGMGGFLSSILITVVQNVTSHGGKDPGWIANNLNRSHIDYFYWLLVVVSSINLLAFIIISHFYTYKKTQSQLVTSKASHELKVQHHYLNESA